MVRLSIALVISTLAFSAVNALTPDPAGDKNIGNGQGKQFITGACLSNADCASTCCARLNGGGICSGPAVAFAQGKQGCGFVAGGGNGNGNGGGNGNTSTSKKGRKTKTSSAVSQPTSGAGTSSGLKPDPAGDKNIGNGQGKQFITGACLSDADCASGCCARLNGGGICSGPAVAFAQGKEGCGFVAAGGNGGNNGGVTSTTKTRRKRKTTTTAAAAAPTTTGAATGSGLRPDPAGDKNIGNGQGKQFITGACLSNADCASTCCARLNGGGICSGPAVAFAQGKQGCGFVAGGNNGGGNPTQTTTTKKPTVTSVVDTSKPGAANVGNGQGRQFITGQCIGDADCASGCCATLRGAGQCSGPAVAFDAGKEGCGFVGVIG